MQIFLISIFSHPFYLKIITPAPAIIPTFGDCA